MDLLSAIDWGAVLKIVGIDIMLGADNAIVIALACAALPANLRGRAMIMGTAAAVLLRALLLWGADSLMGVPYLKLVAGLYLLYIGYKLLMDGDGEGHKVSAADKMMAAVKTIVVADFMMSLDNVLAVASAAHSAGEHSTIYAIAGIVLSIPVIVFGAKYLMAIMERFTIIMWLGAGLLGWVGAEMTISDPFLADYLARVHEVLGDYTHLSFKIAGFVAVVFSVIAGQHLIKHKTAKTAAA